MMSKFLKTLLATTLFAQVAFAADADKTPEANAKTEQTVSLSVGEMKIQAQQYKGEVASGVTQIDQQLASAKEKRDVIKANCLNTALVEATAKKTIVDQNVTDIDKAQDLGTASHAYSKITIAYQQVLVLMTTANECVGEELGHVGTQQNSTTVAATVRTDKVTNPTPPILVGTTKPGQAINPDTMVRIPVPSPYL
jgi:TolA-binding protein